MSIKGNDKQEKKRRSQEPQQVTRRQFLKEAGIIVGGAAIASLALSSACSSSRDTTNSGTNTTTSPNTTTKTTTTTTTTTNKTTILPPAEGFVYKTPSEQPPKMAIPGCTTFTATDRKYIIEHMWIKMVAENIVAIGITEKLAEFIVYIYEMNFAKIGQSLKKEGIFGYIDGNKMDVELFSPVSGTVLQVNNGLYDLNATVIEDPYVTGWLVTVQLSNPEEWEELLTPQEYTDLNAKVVE